jgi:hypothetical protein
MNNRWVFIFKNIYPFQKELTFHNYKMVNFGCFEKKNPLESKNYHFQLCQKLQRTNGFMAIIFPNIIYGNYLKAWVIYQNW